MNGQTAPRPDAFCFDLITKLLFESDSDLLVHRVVTEAVELAKADGGSLILPDIDGSLVVKYAWSPDGRSSAGAKFGRGQGVAGWVAEHNEPVILNSAREDSRFHALSETGYIHSIIAVPFPFEEQIGVISLYAARQDAFNGVQLENLECFAVAAALILSQSQAKARAERERERFKLAHDMSRAVLSTSDFESQVAAVCSSIAQHLGFSRCSVGMVSDDGRWVRGVAAIGLPPSYIRSSNSPVADLPGVRIDRAIGRCAKRGATVLCLDRSADPNYLESLDTPHAYKTYATEYVCIPLKAHGDTIGVITISPLAGEGHLTDEIVSALESFCDIISLVILQARTEQTTREAYREILSSLAAVIETRDIYTGMHAENVLARSMALAKEIGIPPGGIEGIQLGAILHDIGKVAIADLILLKPGNLEGGEIDEMHRHTTIGSRLLANARFLRPARAIVEHHHERWDGKGYPSGLKGDEIPLAAQIVAIADSFDAMTTDRPYRNCLSIDEAKERLRSSAGSQFNPILVDAFLRVLEKEKRSENYALTMIESDGALRCRCTGDFTLDAGRELLEKAGRRLSSEQDIVLMDLSGVTSVSDAGAWMLMRLSVRCAAFGGTLLAIGDDLMRERLPLRIVTASDAERFIRKHREAAMPSPPHAAPLQTEFSNVM